MSGKKRIKYVNGDLFAIAKPPFVLVHVANCRNCWGAGFVVPLAHYFPQAKLDYHAHFEPFRHKSKLAQDSQLGQVIWSNLRDVSVAHMIAQTLEGERPLRYDYLVDCMREVGDEALSTERPICAPMFGSGLAGGNKEFIHCLITDIWKGIDVTIYYL